MRGPAYTSDEEIRASGSAAQVKTTFVPECSVDEHQRLVAEPTKEVVEQFGQVGWQQLVRAVPEFGARPPAPFDEPGFLVVGRFERDLARVLGV
jgi:hypothetical protein